MELCCWPRIEWWTKWLNINMCLWSWHCWKRWFIGKCFDWHKWSKCGKESIREDFKSEWLFKRRNSDFIWVESSIWSRGICGTRWYSIWREFYHWEQHYCYRRWKCHYFRKGKEFKWKARPKGCKKWTWRNWYRL